MLVKAGCAIQIFLCMCVCEKVTDRDWQKERNMSVKCACACCWQIPNSGHDGENEIGFPVKRTLPSTSSGSPSKCSKWCSTSQNEIWHCYYSKSIAIQSHVKAFMCIRYDPNWEHSWVSAVTSKAAFSTTIIKMEHTDNQSHWLC